MAEKDFNRMLHDKKNMPVIKTLTDEKVIRQYGGPRMLVAPAIAYDELLRKIPKGKLTVTGDIRAHLAQQAGADFTDPLTAGIFISLAAQASQQRAGDATPYWRALKAKGELNEKFPGGAAAQRQKLEGEGHTVVQRGKRFFVEGYADKLWDFG